MFNGNTSGYSLADIAAATGGNDRNNGWGGDCWWIVLFILILAGGDNWGNGLFGGGKDATASGITDGYILTTDFANIERKIDSINNGICDGFYAMNTGMLNGFNSLGNAIQGAQADVTAAVNADTIANMQNTNAITSQLTGIGTQIAQCCCDQRYESATQFANLNYNIADQSCQTRRAIADSSRDIIANQDANTRSILDFLTQDKIATLTAENQSLKFAASQAAQNTYLVNALSPAPVPSYQVPNPYTGMYGYRACCNTGCGCTV